MIDMSEQIFIMHKKFMLYGGEIKRKMFINYIFFGGGGYDFLITLD